MRIGDKQRNKGSLSKEITQNLELDLFLYFALIRHKNIVKYESQIYLIIKKISITDSLCSFPDQIPNVNIKKVRARLKASIKSKKITFV
jgi:hypothetical protein